MTEKANGRTITIGEVRFSYLHAWEPAAAEGSTEKKYSSSVLWPKKDEKTTAAVKAAIEAAISEGKDTLGSGTKRSSLKLPLRDGDEKKDDAGVVDPNYVGMWYLSASAKTQPGIVDDKVKPILEQGKVYSGMYGNVNLTMFAFNKAGNKGVGVALNHIQKLKDGAALGGRPSLEAAFGAAAFDEDDEI